MKRRVVICLLLACLAAAGLCPAAAAAQASETALKKAAAYVAETVPTPAAASIGGEWAVIGRVRSGETVPQKWKQHYQTALASRLRETGGVLSSRKNTEYARAILALSALGVDARRVAGYDLTKPLGDAAATLQQGLNGPVFALLALDSARYPMPSGATATREKYLDNILSRQLKSGGWTMSGTTADPDATAMVLQALAKYTGRKKVGEAVEKGLACLSEMQKNTGGYASYGQENAESCAQVLTALCELGISPYDARFVKQGKTVLNALLAYQTAEGGFRHTAADQKPNAMASEQALYALAAYRRFENGQNSLYRMNDVLHPVDAGAYGLPGRSALVGLTAAGNPAAFQDVPVSDPDFQTIRSLAARGVLEGRGNGLFDPDASMTRAEFCAVMCRALVLPKNTPAAFTDVPKDKWFASYIGAAVSAGVVKGVGQGRFAPNGTITREMAAVMAARAAKLCGMNPVLTESEADSALKAFSDGQQVSGWAKNSVAFCVRAGLLRTENDALNPQKAISRRDIADLLTRLLKGADLW